MFRYIFIVRTEKQQILQQKFKLAFYDFTMTKRAKETLFI